MTKWENFPSGYADKPVESQHGGQNVFWEFYIKSPWRERRPLPARYIPMQLGSQLLDPVNTPLNYWDMCFGAIRDMLSEIGIYYMSE
jgi:hypothetical protein